ncbi:NAD-P-binding protein [Amylocystis lapponica]|nr:NAD-P-binding protein [Amylocystis lapponica]
MSKTAIFFLGATGYIGGSVLQRLIQHPNVANFEITVLLRAEQKAKKLETYGVHAVVGSLADTDKLESLASQADVVFNCADADNVDATKAILRGLKNKYDATGVTPVLIHTSGTGVLTTNNAATIYDDSDPTQIESLAPTQVHRVVDLEIVGADAKGYIKSYIVLPSVIWGLASGPLVDAGIVNPHSMLIPMIIKASLDRGQAGTVGEGKNIWPYVNIDEVVDLYIILLDNILSGTPVGHGREGFYFGENGEHSLYDISRAIGAAMVELGKAKTDEVTSFSKAELDKYLGPAVEVVGANSRCHASRSRSIGWKPVKGPQDVLASIKPEIEAILAKQA